MSLWKQTPSDFLKQIIGCPVVVKLSCGVDYQEVLACLGGYVNTALGQTEEHVKGQLQDKHGDAFIRGNNVSYISTRKRKDTKGTILFIVGYISYEFFFLFFGSFMM
ncbi:U6 snRNA-associated Sm-like protein LSm6 [Cynocephalus volans]|uniref:U6 snRNA-associated Sm-like protein LSm6 n=1 Tax=Cynocephalus volans TaxID=110931 RepID=UPI002FCB6134